MVNTLENIKSLIESANIDFDFALAAVQSDSDYVSAKETIELNAYDSDDSISQLDIIAELKAWLIEVEEELGLDLHIGQIQWHFENTYLYVYNLQIEEAKQEGFFKVTVIGSGPKLILDRWELFSLLNGMARTESNYQLLTA